MNEDSYKSKFNCEDRLKILADKTRLAVVRCLMGGPKSVADINHKLHLEQSLLSHHLKTLREAGLVVAERRGKSVTYQLSKSVALQNDVIDLSCCTLSFQEVEEKNHVGGHSAT